MAEAAAEEYGRARRLLLERDSELSALEGALTALCGAAADDSAAHHGGVLAFEGSAGLGKTTLLYELRRRASERGCTVLSARGGEQEQQVAFHVVRQLIQRLLAAASERERREILGDWYAIVAPAIGLAAPAGGGKPDPQGVRDGLDWVVTKLTVRSAPVVLTLDDAHWADMESLDWLTSFAARAGELPILVVVAYRPDELPADAVAFRKLAVRHGSRPHELEPLSAAGVGRIVRDALGEGADDVFCRECWTVTGGNPFEAVELTAKVGDHGLKPRQENIPELRDLASAVKGNGLVERLERFRSSTVRLAWAAAVLGTEISPTVAGSIATTGVAETGDAIEDLRTARILTVVPNGKSGGVLEFFHPLVATAVYRSIPPATRVAMHGKAAQAVIDAGQGVKAAARHLLEVHPDGDDQVVRRLRQAAGEYLRAGAPEAARRCLTRALREPPDLRDRAGVLYELGCSAALQEPTTTVNHLREALEEPEIDPQLRESVTHRLAQALAHSDRMDEAAQILTEEYERASSARARLRLQADLIKWNAFRADEEDPIGRARRLVHLSDRLPGKNLTERHILGLRSVDAVVNGEPASTALRFAERALDGGLSWTDESWGFETPTSVALTFMYCDQPGRAEELFNRGIAEFEAKGWRGSHLSFAYTLLGYIRFWRGRFVEAEDFVRTGLQIADRVGHGVTAQWYAIGILIKILLARGRTGEAEAIAETYGFGVTLAKAVVFPDAQAVYGELLLAQGQREEAERHLAAAGRRLDRRGARNPAWCPWQLDLAVAQVEERPEQARLDAEEAVARARAFGTASAIGQALRAFAAVTDGPEATGLLAEACGHLENSPAAYELARALVDHGAALRRSGSLQDAADQLYRGMDTAATCGAEGLVERARAELVAAGLRPRRLRKAGKDSLTGPENAVAMYAAEGSDNATIAVELHQNEAAVAKLLSAVFTKLGTDRAGLPRALGL